MLYDEMRESIFQYFFSDGSRWIKISFGRWNEVLLIQKVIIVDF